MSLSRNTSILPTLFESVLKVFLGHPTTILDFLFDILQRIPYLRTLPGMYQVLEYHSELELLDKNGKRAVYRKRLKVRFLQDVIAFYDKAWGDGDIFADYKCSPGVKVDQFRDGYRYNILISLRETKHRGDEATFNIERHITNGFTGTDETLQTDIDHRTRKLSMSVIFPKSHQPSQINLIKQNKKTSLPLDNEYRHILPDGRYQYIWKTNSPALFESYIMRWIQ